MKITILANQDLASCIALNHLLPLLQEHQLRIFLSARVGKSRDLAQELVDLRFYEQQLFNNIVFPIAAALDVEKAALCSFDAMAEDIGCSILELNAINSSDFELFKSTTPDLVLSIRYGGILKDAVIAVPRFGVLNLHSGLLPAYKGVMATFRAMLYGEHEVGTTLHYIDDSGVDTGRIIGTTVMSVDRRHSYLWHVLELYEDGCRLMGDAVRELAASGLLASKPQAAGGSYFSFPSEAELTSFARLGYKLTDTDELTAVVKRFIGPG